MSFFDDEQYIQELLRQTQQRWHINGADDKSLCDSYNVWELPEQRKAWERVFYATPEDRHQMFIERCREEALNVAEYWRRDNTPPEKRDRLFYAQRYVDLFDRFLRSAEWFLIPFEEKLHISKTKERYQELVSILKGYSPFTHHWDVLGDRGINYTNYTWKYWPNTNTDDNREETAV